MHRPTDRLQPALLDRLLDDAPEVRQVEPVAQRLTTAAQLRAAVLRDLTSLFNATAPELSADPQRYPHVHASVLSFGLPPLTGRAISSIEPAAWAEVLRQAIMRHEPRILREGLSVHAVDKDASPRGDGANRLSFHIVGQLWAQPVPLDMLLRTDIDLDSGQVRIDEPSSRGQPSR